jgi:hypothetical protein
MLFGPAGINIRSDLMGKMGPDPDMVKLVLERLANFWNLAKLLLGKINDISCIVVSCLFYEGTKMY